MLLKENDIIFCEGTNVLDLAYSGLLESAKNVEVWFIKENGTN